MASTARLAVRAGLYGLEQGFQSANQTLVFASYTVRPGAFGEELPALFVGNMNEPNIVHTSGVRQRNFVTEIVIVDTFAPSNEEQAARLDLVVDPLLDWLTAHPDYIAGMVMAPTSVTDGELTVPGGNVTVHYRAISIAIGVTVQEGRN